MLTSLGTFRRLTLVCSAGAALGVLTAYAQGWLPPELGSLANSTGSWALVAFCLALLAAGPGWAAAFGCLALLTLLGGYVVGADIRGYPSSMNLLLFWGAAALVAGPLLGLGAHWGKTGRGLLAAAGAGGISGVLIGEGAYGLRYIADTTYPPYWWGELIAGLVLLALIAGLRLRTPTNIVAAVGLAALSAGAFVLLYSQDLIALL